MSNNNFSMDTFRGILESARSSGYRFMTLKDYVSTGCPKDKVFVLRMDLDLKPQSLKPVLAVLRDLAIPMTLFVRVSGPYNIFWYPVQACLKEAVASGCEIGLHTTPVEWALINGCDIEHTLSSELAALRSMFHVSGIAPHRDINYVHNSLPWIDENWQHLQKSLNIDYHAYEDRILRDLLYVNEGLSPHLGWRNMKPEEAIASGKPIYMLLHPHWWYVSNPFETD